MARRRGSPLRAFGGRFVIALGAAAAVMVGAVIGVNYVIDQKLDKIPRVNVTTAPELPGGANYLLIGSDSRSFVKDSQQRKTFGDPSVEQGSRSDTMMVIHVEPATKRTLIVSFPRDLWVDVPGISGKTKINAAFNAPGGGADRLIKTLENNFSIPINHYLEVDFQSFQGIVDAIGSVPVYIPEPAIDEFTGFIAINAGCYHLGGYDALQWVRTRHIKFLDPATGKMREDASADIGRIKRQQEFIRRLAALAVRKSLSNPLTANDIAGEVVSHLKVDQGLSKDDIFSLIDAFRGINPDDTTALDFETYQGKLGTANGQSVLFPQKTEMQPLVDRLRNFDNGAAIADVDPSSMRLRVLNGSGKEGEANGALDAFRGLGFETAGTANDPRGTVSVGEVRYATGKESAGKLVLSYVSPAARLVHDPSLDGTSADVVVVLGTDFDHINAPAAASSTAATVPSTATTGGTNGAAAGSGQGPASASGTPAEDPAAACR